MASRFNPKTAEEFATRLHALRERRRKKKARVRARGDGSPRAALTAEQRERILSKTGRRCHLCGGRIDPAKGWQADHVRSRSSGGAQEEDNYLPAHAVCNKYRLDYSPEEFRWILKVGVYTVNQIRRKSPIGMDLAKPFIAKETCLGRRKPPVK